MTVTTEDRNRQNVWAKEPQMEVMDVTVLITKKLNCLMVALQ